MKWLLCLFYLHYICVILYANKLLTVWNFLYVQIWMIEMGPQSMGTSYDHEPGVDLYKGCTPPLGGACHKLKVFSDSTAIPLVIVATG